MRTYNQHRSVFNHKKVLLQLYHEDFKAGEEMRNFENAGMAAAQTLAQHACVEPFFNKVRSAGGEKGQYYYVLYVATKDGGATPA